VEAIVWAAAAYLTRAASPPDLLPTAPHRSARITLTARGSTRRSQILEFARMEAIQVSKPFSLGLIAVVSRAGERSSVSTTAGAIRLTIGAPVLWTLSRMLAGV